jgi:hypothetical protein
MPVIGFLGTDSPELYALRLRGFREGLRETGHVEGRNLAFEYRWAEGHYDRLTALVAELISLNVNLIGAFARNAPALAAKAATRTIPILFATAGDPVAVGQHEPSGRQYYGCDHADRGAGCEATGSAPRADPNGKHHSGYTFQEMRGIWHGITVSSAAGPSPSPSACEPHPRTATSPGVSTSAPLQRCEAIGNGRRVRKFRT